MIHMRLRMPSSFQNDPSSPAVSTVSVAKDSLCPDGLVAPPDHALHLVAGRFGECTQLSDAAGHDHRRDGGVEGVLAGGCEPAKVRRYRYRLQVPFPFARVVLAHRAGEDPGEDLHDQRQPRRVEGPDPEAGAGEPVQRLHAVQRSSADLAGADQLEHRLRLDAR
jgi:hypothetical protein